MVFVWWTKNKENGNHSQFIAHLTNIYPSSHQENEHVGNNTGGPKCEQATMASSSGMNQNDFFFVQNKEPPRGQSMENAKLCKH
jgi:hypothetical protein